MRPRLDRAGAAIVNSLRLARACGEPGCPTLGGLAGDLAIIFRTQLGPIERLTIAGAGVLSLDPEPRERLAEATFRDLGAQAMSDIEREAERQRRQWAMYCASSTYRSPPLTREQQRRADAISFDDSPREQLAAAWLGATDRDRRDLIARALGRDAA